MPSDLLQLQYIDRFGAQSVMGRTLGATEIRRMVSSDNIVGWYKQRQMSKDWSEWAKENKQASEFLNNAMLLAIKKGLIDGS